MPLRSHSADCCRHARWSPTPHFAPACSILMSPHHMWNMQSAERMHDLVLYSPAPTCAVHTAVSGSDTYVELLSQCAISESGHASAAFGLSKSCNGVRRDALLIISFAMNAYTIRPPHV
jgi:hypothetical protein